jgi:holo-[acyl-carrier protein] synthase
MWADAATASPISVGVDVVDVARFRGLLARRTRVTARLFTTDELAYAARFADPVPRLAVRFAAKEAAMKALGVGIGAVAFHDVCVHRADNGEPRLELFGRAVELANDRGVGAWALSLTHTSLLAAAVVVGLER